MKFKYILFDLDGTLTDPREGITKSVQHALKYFNIDVEDLESLNKFIGPPLKEAFIEYFNLSDAQGDIALAKYRERFSTVGWKENLLLEKTEKTLKKLFENEYSLILATSKPLIFASKILDYFNISKYFKLIVGSDLDGTRSNKKDVISYILEKENIKNKSEVIMVGDRMHDIIGAKENKIKSIGVLFGFGSIEELQNADADYIISDFDEIYDIIE